ncbi:MAG: TolB family protein [Calditrichia bacterium]
MVRLQQLLIIFLILVPLFAVSQDYEILFTKQVNGNDHLYVINTNGKSKQLTNHPRKDSTPVMSPDGNRIVFASERVGWWKIWLLELAGNTFSQLTDANGAEYAPAWSPDGSNILFVSGRGGNSNIFSMSKNGANQTSLSKPSESETMPFWGLDNRIYFSAKRGDVYQIVSMSPDGTARKALTESKGDKLMPSLSPDGVTLLFYGNVDGDFEIYTMNLSTQKLKRLTNHPLMDIRPRWSDDGKKIVFERGDKKRNQHIYLMNADGSDVQQLTKENYNYSPSFVVSTTSLVNGERN